MTCLPRRLCKPSTSRCDAGVKVGGLGDGTGQCRRSRKAAALRHGRGWSRDHRFKI